MEGERGQERREGPCIHLASLAWWLMPGLCGQTVGGQILAPPATNRMALAATDLCDSVSFSIKEDDNSSCLGVPVQFM